MSHTAETESVVPIIHTQFWPLEPTQMNNLCSFFTTLVKGLKGRFKCNTT